VAIVGSSLANGWVFLGCGRAEKKRIRDSSLLSRMKQNERTDGNGESELKGQGAELLRCLFEVPSWRNPHLPTAEAVGILSREITGEVSGQYPQKNDA
jgi:hypothetical protein